MQTLTLTLDLKVQGTRKGTYLWAPTSPFLPPPVPPWARTRADRGAAGASVPTAAQIGHHR
jgi:hypothetical protein